MYPVNFADGQANLYVYDGFADKYYDIISGASIFISIVICILIFGSELQDEIKNIQHLDWRSLRYRYLEFMVHAQHVVRRCHSQQHLQRQDMGTILRRDHLLLCSHNKMDFVQNPSCDLL